MHDYKLTKNSLYRVDTQHEGLTPMKRPAWTQRDSPTVDSMFMEPFTLFTNNYKFFQERSSQRPIESQDNLQ